MYDLLSISTQIIVDFYATGNLHIGPGDPSRCLNPVHLVRCGFALRVSGISEFQKKSSTEFIDYMVAIPKQNA